MTSPPPAFVLANWKMNPASIAEAQALLTALTHKLKNPVFTQAIANHTAPTVAIAPSFVHLMTVQALLDTSPIQLSAQNVCGENASHGAFTGEIAAKQLIDIGVTSVIIGHSERRQYFNEDNEILTQKLDCALSQGLNVVFCVGETLEQYENQQTQVVVSEQLIALQPFLTDKFVNKILIAYEPVWAIGTGKVPTVAEVTQVHQFIIDHLVNNHAGFIHTPILYGGSVKAENAKDFAKSPTVSGVLVGGASLNPEDFWQIIQAFC